jgi:hypothetical protein
MATVKQGGRQLTVGPRTARVIRGEDDLSEWSDRELEYGTRRLKGNRWPPKPKVVATQVHDELVRRRLKKGIHLLRTSTVDAVRVLIKIVRDEEASNRDRLKAAELILDRALGKAPEHVNVSLGPDLAPWQQMMADSIVMVGTEEQAALPPAPTPDDDVIEGEIVEEPEPPKRAPIRVPWGDKVVVMTRPDPKPSPKPLPEPKPMADEHFWPHGPLLPLAPGEEYLVECEC